MRRAWLLLLPCALWAGCATTELKTEVLHNTATVDGKEVGAIPPGGTAVEIPPGLSPVPWTLQKDGVVVASGELPRTEPMPWVIGAGIAGTACCVPSLAAVACCAVNPAVMGSLVSCLLLQNIGALFTLCATPSWLTLPAVFCGSAVGMLPAGAGALLGAAPGPAHALMATPKDAAPKPESPPAPAPVAATKAGRHGEFSW